MLTRQGCLLEDPGIITKAKRELNVAPIDRSGLSQRPKYIQIWWTVAGKIYVPRFWDPGYLYSRTKDFGPITPLTATFSGKLKQDLDQPRAVAAVLKSMHDTGGAVLSLGTGQGKTTCACYIIAHLKVKTIVLVHKDILRTQWAERVAQFLPDAKVSFVQGDTCDLSGDVVVAMIQTVVQRNYDFPGFGLVTVDECFPYTQQILTEHGPMNIGKIYNLWKDGKKVRVQSFNEKTRAFELKEVTHAWQKSTTELVKISYSKSNYRATENHPVLTTEGWKPTGDIVPGDLLISRYAAGLAEQAVALAMNPDQYQLFLGSLLGDGHMHNLPSKRFRLCITHGPKQRDYIKWKAGVFGVETRSFIGGYLNATEYAFNTRVIDLPRHKTFQSHKTNIPQWVLDELDARGLAIWFMDDGSLEKCGGMTLSTHTFDEDTHRRMCLKLADMGIMAMYTVAKKGDKSYFYIRINTVSGRFMAEMIAPYIHPSMAYKVLNARSLVSEESVGSYSWNHEFLPFGTLCVTSVQREIPEDTRVYDLEVQGTHTFVCSSFKGNGPVVHNCHHIAAETFSTAMHGLCCPYSLGLSATPERKDGLTKVMHWFLGPLAYSTQRAQLTNVSVTFVRYTSAVYRLPPPLTKFGTVNFAAVLTDMADDAVRTQVIVDRILEIRKDPARIVLVLSHRRDHCTAIASKIPGAVAFLGGAKRKSTEHTTAPVVCATYSLASEGYDDPRLNTLVLATPCSDVTQAAGRILRGMSTVDPMIIDVQDDFSIAYAQSAKRKAYYRKAGFSMQNERIKYDACIIVD